MSQVPNFKTNVNRAKTKRWVEAKSYTYDGDDWGDADEYDEYGGYDEPAPPPPKPTGLRQRGQSATQSAQPPVSQVPPPQNDGRRGYGNIGGQPSAVPPQGLRSATNPQPRLNTNLERSNSFERGDETRAFSADGYQQGEVQRSNEGIAINNPRLEPKAPPQPRITDFPVQSPEQMHTDRSQPLQPQVPIQQSAPSRARADSRSIQDSARTYSLGGTTQSSIPAQHLPPSDGSRAQSLTGSQGPPNFQTQRQIPQVSNIPPSRLQRTPPPPGLESSKESQPFRPPRKSSLGQHTQTPPTYSIPPSMEAAAERSVEEPQQRERSSSNVGKPLPFVRPADIYRRMQEEKERERQSQESFRPGADAVDEERDGSDDVPEPPTIGEPVASSSITHQQIPETPSHDQAANSSSGVRSANNLSSVPVAPTQANELGQGFLPQFSGTSQPLLPNVARVSTFGSSFLDLGGDRRRPEIPQAQVPAAKTQGTSTSTTPATGESEAPAKTETTLQHQPSAGFRSIVNQAFDQAPATPSSGTGSTLDRSVSGSTTTRSPPISRGPSSATENIASRMKHDRGMSPPPKVMDTVPEERRMSAGSGATPKSERPLSQGPLNSPPQAIIPGHRRNLSTPSPDNSPARTPAIEKTAQLQSPREAEIAIATPVSPKFAGDTRLLRSPSPPFTESSGILPQRSVPDPIYREPLALNTNNAPPNTSRASSPTKSLVNSIRDREGSPSTNRVKDIAGKFESASRRGSDQSLSEKVKPTKAGSPERISNSPRTRPPPDRLASFRPQLPGGWDSYTATDSSEIPTDHVATEKASGNTQTSSMGEPSQTEEPDERRAQSMQRNHNDEQARAVPAGPIQDPFAALSAAGSALAGALTAARSNPNKIEDDTAIQSDKNASADSHIPNQTQEQGRLVAMPPPPSPERTPRQVPPQLPSLDTERKPQYESDRLRREIVKSLSPNKTSEPTTADTESSWQVSPPDLSSVPKAQRSGTGLESPTMPSGYNSYWNDSSSDGSARSKSRRRRPRSLKNIPGQVDADSVKPLTPRHLKNGHPDELEIRSSGPDVDGERPSLGPQRFSWERPGSTLTSAIDTSTIGDRRSAPSDTTVGQTFVDEDDPVEPAIVQEHGVRPRNDSLNPSHKTDFNDNLPSVPLESNVEAHTYTEEPSLAVDAPQKGPTPDAQTRGTALSHQEEPDDGRHMNMSLQDPGQIQTRSDSPGPYVGDITGQPRIAGFREILALKTPEERINAFNHARQQYATVDSGLRHWLTVMQKGMEQSPNDQTTAFPSGNRNLLPNQSSNTVNAQPGNALAPANRSHGSSPSSTKINRQQLQSKGKDLLKDANVLSGKANVAAKGLFMKGRNKLRGTDKASNSSPSPDPSRVTQPQYSPSQFRSHQSSSSLPFQGHPSLGLQHDARGPMPGPTSYSQIGIETTSVDAQKAGNPNARVENADTAQRNTDSTLHDASGFDHQETSVVTNLAQGPRRQIGLSLDTASSTDQPQAQADTRHVPHEDQGEIGSAGPTPFSAVSDKAPSFHLPKITPSRFSTWEIKTPPTTRPTTKDGVSTDEKHTPTSPTLPGARGVGVEQQGEPFDIPRISKDSVDHTGDSSDNAHTDPIAQASEGGGLAPPKDVPLATDVNSGSAPHPWGSVQGAQPSPMSPRFHVKQPIEHSPVSEDHSDQPPSPVSPQRSIVREAPEQERPPGPTYFGPNHDFDVAPSTPKSQHPMRHSRSISRLSDDPDVGNHPAFRRDRSPSSGNVYQRRSGEQERNSLTVPHTPSPAIEAEEQIRARESSDAQAASKRTSRGSGFFKALAPPSNQVTPSSKHSENLEEFPIRPDNGKEKKGKRGSLFRSLTGQASSQNNHNSNPNPARNAQPGYTESPYPRLVESGRQPSGISISSSLQRASTTGTTDQEKGKKKRFSKLGSLFGGRAPQTSGNMQPQASQVSQQRPREPSFSHSTQGSTTHRGHQEWAQRNRGLGPGAPQYPGQAQPQISPSMASTAMQQSQGPQNAPRLDSDDRALQQKWNEAPYRDSVQQYLSSHRYQPSQPMPQQYRQQEQTVLIHARRERPQYHQYTADQPANQSAMPSGQLHRDTQSPLQDSNPVNRSSQSSWLRRSTAGQNLVKQQQSEGQGASESVSSQQQPRNIPSQAGVISEVPLRQAAPALGPSVRASQLQPQTDLPTSPSKSKDLPAYMEDVAMRQPSDKAQSQDRSDQKKSKDRSSKSKSSLFSRSKSTDLKTVSINPVGQAGGTWTPRGDSIQAGQVRSGPLNVKDVKRLSQPLVGQRQERQGNQAMGGGQGRQMQVVDHQASGSQQYDRPAFSQQNTQTSTRSRQSAQQRNLSSSEQHGQIPIQYHPSLDHQSSRPERSIANMPYDNPRHRQQSQIQGSPSSPEGPPPPPPPKDSWHVSQPRGPSSMWTNQQAPLARQDTFQTVDTTYDPPPASPPPMISPIQQQQPLNFNPGVISPATTSDASAQPQSHRQQQVPPSLPSHPSLAPQNHYQQQFQEQQQQQRHHQRPPASYQQHRPPALPPLQTSVPPPHLTSPTMKSSSVLPASHMVNPILGPRPPKPATTASRAPEFSEEEEETIATERSKAGVAAETETEMGIPSSPSVKTPKTPEERQARAREIERNSLVLTTPAAAPAASSSKRNSKVLVAGNTNPTTANYNNNGAEDAPTVKDIHGPQSQSLNLDKDIEARSSNKEVVPFAEGLEHDTRGEASAAAAEVEAQHKKQEHDRADTPLDGGTRDALGKDEEEEEEEEIVMSPVAYPGQMWTPGGMGMGGWEHF